MNEVAEAVYDDITVSGNADEGDTAPSAAPTVVEQAGEAVDIADGHEESEATKAAKTLAAQKKKNDPEKRKGSIQDEINAETARKHAAKKEADAEEARLATVRLEREALERPPAKDEPKPEAPAFYTRPRPTQDEIGGKYADWEAYNDDLQDWKLDEREAKRDRETQARSQQQFQREVLSKAQERITAFKADHADYDEVVGKAMIPAGSVSAQAVIDHLNHSEFGPQLAYELAQSPAELARIAGLPFGFAIAALGRLEKTIELRTAAADSGPAPTAPTYKKTEPPIKPVGSSPVTSSDEGDPDDLSEAAVNAHLRRENAKDFKRRQR